jgi:hypothetical protein
MTALRASLKEYLGTRRALGFQLRVPGRNLHKFVSFLEQQGATYITTDLALRWATQPRGAAPAYQADRLAHVRRFAAWRTATDPRTEVPPRGLLPHRNRRKPPSSTTTSRCGMCSPPPVRSRHRTGCGDSRT